MFTAPLSGFPIWNTDSRFNWLYCHLRRSLISEPSVRLCASLCKTTVGIIFICRFLEGEMLFMRLYRYLSPYFFPCIMFYIYQPVPEPLTCCFYRCLLLCAFYFIIKGKNKSLFSTPFIPSFGSSTSAIPFWRCGFPLQSCDLKRPCKVKPRLKKCGGCLAGILSAKKSQTWEFHLSCTTRYSRLIHRRYLWCLIYSFHPLPWLIYYVMAALFGDIFTGDDTYSFSGTVMSSSINISLLSKLYLSVVKAFCPLKADPGHCWLHHIGVFVLYHIGRGKKHLSLLCWREQHLFIVLLN